MAGKNKLTINFTGFREYMEKLDRFIVSRTQGVKDLNNQSQLRACYDKAAAFYKTRNPGNRKTGVKK